jgi:uncharacterized membrane protein
MADGVARERIRHRRSSIIQDGGRKVVRQRGDQTRAHPEDDLMRTFILIAAFLLSATAAHAQSPTCKAQAAEKKLAGAAQTSFLKKCESDAKKSCDADSKAKKLSGAAKNSHMKKCVEDAVGT